MKKLLLLLAAFVMLCSFSKEPFKEVGKHVFFEIENSDLSDIEIHVIDQNFRILFSETLNHKYKIKKDFNFESTIPGVYTIEIVDGDTKYVKKVKI